VLAVLDSRDSYFDAGEGGGPDFGDDGQPEGAAEGT
jgi:hypothetical protein